MSKVKKLWIWIIAVILVIGIGGFVVYQMNPSIFVFSSKSYDLTGEWKEADTSGSYQQATIKNGIIEIYWKNDKEGMTALYWYGTYVAPTVSKGDYSWVSVKDKEKTEYKIMASQDDTKTFTYDGKELSYSASTMGVTKTVKLKKLN